MPSAPLRPRPSLQNLNNGNEYQLGKHKPFAQAYAVHRRDAPLNALPNFPLRDPRLPSAIQFSSPAVKTDDAGPELDLLPKPMAGVQRCTSLGLLRPSVV